MAALKQVTLEAVTTDQLDEMVRAWATWMRIRDSVQSYLTVKGSATGTWYQNPNDFLDGVDASGISIAGINSMDDGEWETYTATITPEELLDMQTRYEQYVSITAVANEMRAAESERRGREAREAQYKKLKEEFEGGPT